MQLAWQLFLLQTQSEISALLLNSTHLTQPLDVAYFRPMKIIWRNILSEWKETGKGRQAPSLPKDEFPRLLNCLMNKMSEHGKENLTAGFCKAGIFPLDKSQVMSQLPSMFFTGQMTQPTVSKHWRKIGPKYIRQSTATAEEDTTGNSHRRSHMRQEEVTVSSWKWMVFVFIQQFDPYFF